MNEKKNIWMSFGFLILAVFSSWLVLKDVDAHSFRQALGRLDLRWLIPAVLCISGFFVFQGRNFQKLFLSFGYKESWISCIRYALVDFYASCITPSGSGGQPAAIAAMHKDGIPVGTATMTNIIYNMLYHVFMVVLALISMLFGVFFTLHGIGAMGIILWFGFFGQAAVTTGFAVFAFSKKLGPGLIGWLSKKKFLKRHPKFRDHMLEQAEEFSLCADILKAKPKAIFGVFLTIVAQLVSSYSMLFFFLKGLGFEDVNYLTVLLIQAGCILAFESIPIPGSFGVAEVGFLAVYSYFFGASNAPVLMILSRTLTLYFGVFSGLIAFLRTTFKGRTTIKNRFRGNHGRSI